MIACILRSDRYIVTYGTSETEFGFANAEDLAAGIDIPTRKAAKREAQAFCRGLSECARVMGNDLHSFSARSRSVEID